MAPPLTRESVIEAARRSIVADGLEAVSLRKLAASLGVTAPALYAYVDDKRDLLRAVAEREFQRLARRRQRIDWGTTLVDTRRFEFDREQANARR